MLTPTQMKQSHHPKSPPLQREIADKAEVNSKTVSRHQNGTSTNTAVALATCAMCQHTVGANMTIIINAITKEVDDSRIKEVCSIYAPADDNQYKTMTECYLLFLHHCANMGLDVRGINFLSDDTTWYLEAIVDNNLVKVASLNRSSAIMKVCNLSIYGDVEFLSQVLTALNRGTKERLL